MLLRPNLKNLKDAFMPYSGKMRTPLTPRRLGNLSRELYATEGWPIRYPEIDEALFLANTVLEGYGVEVIVGNYRGHRMDVALYVNMGDTYAPTIIYDTIKEKFYVGDLGTFVELRGHKYKVE